MPEGDEGEDDEGGENGMLRAAEGDVDVPANSSIYQPLNCIPKAVQLRLPDCPQVVRPVPRSPEAEC